MMRLGLAVFATFALVFSIVTVDAIGSHLLPADWTSMTRCHAQLLIVLVLYALVGAFLVGIAKRTFLK